MYLLVREADTQTKGNDMDRSHLLRTDRTYATRANAVRALVKATGGDLSGVRYVIAVAEDGRYAPVVVFRNPEDLGLIHRGVTVVS